VASNLESQEKPRIVVTAKALNCLPEKKSGSRFAGGCCPKDHGSKGNRCFWIYPATESYFCQSCKHGGDSLDLIMFAKDCTFPEALTWAREKGLVSSNGHKNVNTSEARLLHQILTEASHFFHESLSDHHRDHLRSHYGLNDDLINEHRLGFAPRDEVALVNHLKGKFKLEDIKKTGLLNKWDRSHFQGQLIFPYWNAGLVKYVIGRQTSESPEWKAHKYDKLPVHDPDDRPFVSQEIKNSHFYGEDSIKDSDTVYVAEGVTDCLTALQHDLPCISPVTTSFAEGDWPKLTSLAKGKTVYLIPDIEDNEAGMKGAERTRAHLEEKGIDCSIIMLPRPEGAEKIDLNEYIRDNGIEAFLNLVKSQSPPCIEDILLEDWNFIKIEIPPKRMLLSPWLSEQSIILITGWRGIGKTWLALLVLNAVTRLEPFGPWKSEISVPCLYLDGEMAAEDVVERLEGIGTGGRKNPLYVYSDAYAAHRGLGRASLIDEKWRNGLKALLIKKGVKLWVLDNVASLTPGIDENSKQDWDPINRWLLDLRFAGISTILLHHEGKEGRQRGTSGREDNIDISISLRKPVDYLPEDGARFITHFSKHRIRTRDLPLIADTEFKVMESEQDGITCVYGDVKKQKKLEILRLSDEELSVSDIAKTVDVAKSYVTKVRQEAIKGGLLSPKGRLTQIGFRTIQNCSENYNEFENRGEQNWWTAKR
jgi:RecA-family ATPase